MVVDIRFSAEKVCDCVVFAGCSKAEVRYVVYWLSCCTRIFCASHKNDSLVFSLAIVPCKVNYRLRIIRSRSSFS